MLATRVHRKNCLKTSCAHSALRPCAIQISVVTFCLEILLMKVSLWKEKGSKPSFFTKRLFLITKLIQEGEQQR